MPLGVDQFDGWSWYRVLSLGFIFMSRYQPTCQDGGKPVKSDHLPDEERDDRGGVQADDHDDEAEGEMEALGQALIGAILERAPPEDVQKLLVEDEAPLWFRDEDGWSALHAAASVEDAGLIKNLLQRGAPWNSGEHEVQALAFDLSSRIR